MKADLLNEKNSIISSEKNKRKKRYRSILLTDDKAIQDFQNKVHEKKISSNNDVLNKWAKKYKRFQWQ